MYKSFLSALLALSFLASPVFAKPPSGTAVPLIFQNQVSAQGLQQGSTIVATVADDVLVDGVVMVSKGATAVLNVVKVRKPKGHDTDGYMVVEGGKVRCADGTDAPLRLTATAGQESTRPKGGWVALSVVGVALTLIPLGMFKLGEPAIFPSAMSLNASVL